VLEKRKERERMEKNELQPQTIFRVKFAAFPIASIKGRVSRQILNPYLDHIFSGAGTFPPPTSCTIKLFTIAVEAYTNVCSWH
jgi:hypothetical protein